MNRPAADPEAAETPTEGAAMPVPWRLCELTLAGFGRYREATRFTFPEGAAILVAPNESGKSTLLSGLAAILFGLPAIKDPAEFGVARFRSFSAPREFWGELAWEQGGHRYRLRRSFDSHRVRLDEETAQGISRLFEGEHNPNARSSAESAFSSLLRERLGLADRALFLETLCVAQPLAEDAELSADLQHLLSGSRSGRLDDVLARLFDEVKGLTRTTGDLGLVKPGNTQPANQKANGRIEELEHRLAETRRDFEQGQSLLADLNQHNDALELAQQQARALRRSLGERDGRVAGLRRWLDLDGERRKRLEALRGADGFLRQLDELETRRRELSPELEARFAAFRTSPADLASRIDAALAAAEAAARRNSEAGALRATRRDLETRCESGRRRLAEEFRDVRGRSDLPARREQLRTAIARRERRELLWTERHDELRRLEERRAADPLWFEVDPGALRPRIEQFRTEWARLEEISRREEEIERELEAKRFLEERGRLEALREKIRREDRLRQIRPRQRELELLLAREQQADETRRARAEAEALTERAATRSLIPIWISGPVALGAGAAVKFAAGGVWGAAIFTALFLFGLMAGVSFLVTRARRRKMRRPAPVSAPVPAADPAVLAEAEAELRTLRAEREELEPGLPALERELGPYAQTTAGELARLEENWRLRGDEQLRLRSDREQTARAYFPGGSEAWREQPVAALPAEIATFTMLLRAMGEEAPAQCGPLVDRIAVLDEVFWKKAAAKARTAREESARRQEVIGEIERLRVEREGDDEEGRLRPLLSPFDENTPEEELRRLLDACAEEEKSLAAAEEQLAAGPDSTEIDRRVAEAAAAEQAALSALGAGWDTAPEPQTPILPWLEHLRAEERAARDAWTEDGIRGEAVQGVYQAAGAKSRDEIQDRRASADAALGAVLRDLEALESSDPFFAATRSIEDPIERGRRLQDEFESEQARLEADRQQAEQAETQERELLRELASLEGRPAPNVAQLEISIRADEAELARLRREREAVTLAFRWVEEAGRQYQGGYREELEQRVSACFELFTGTPGRRLRLDEKFRVQAVDPDGQLLSPAQLSQGAHDQLFLAIRLAVADLLGGVVELPLFFDDPFLHFDADRLARLHEALGKLGERRQWILLTHREEFRSWGRPVESVAG